VLWEFRGDGNNILWDSRGNLVVFDIYGASASMNECMNDMNESAVI